MFKGFGRGAIALIISGFVCKFFGALFRLPLTSILGIQGIGVFQMVMSLYSLALVFVTGGVTNSLSQLVSSARARGEGNKIGDYFRLSIILTTSIALLIGLSFFVFAGNIAHVQGVSEGALSYKLFLVLIPIGAFIGVLRGIIQGYENMVPTAVSQIIEQVFKLVLGLGLAYMFAKRSVASGVFGGFLGITLSELLAFIYLGIVTLKRIKFDTPVQKGNFPVLIGAIVPLSLSGAVIPFTHAFDSLVIVSRLMKAGFSKELSTSLFGLQTGVVGAILNFPLIISLALAMTLLPKISYLSSKRDYEGQKEIIKNSFIAMWAVVLPLTFGIVAISSDLYLTIYPTTIGLLLPQAIELTMLGGVSIILTAIMQFLLSILHARGFFIYSFIASAIGGLAKIILVYTLAGTSTINIFAIPISNIVLAIIVCIMVLIKLGGLVKVPAFYILTPLLSSIIMYLLVKLLATASLSHLWIMILGVLIGGVSYFIFAFPVLRGLFLRFFGKNKVEEQGDEKK